MRAAATVALLVFLIACGRPPTDVDDRLASVTSSHVESPGTSPVGSPAGGAPSAADAAAVDRLTAFARSLDGDDLAAVPLSDDGLWLGLADGLLVSRQIPELADPQAWKLDQEAFRGHAGPFSALELLANATDVELTVGEHARCASPPVPAPPEVAGLRRVGVQPTDIDTCLRWWTVDLFMAPDGTIAAVTLDLWEP